MGYFADVAVIDVNTVRNRAEYLDPHQYSEGIAALLVNGVVAIENGKVTGDRGGKPVRMG